jgi:hypothetical protein
MSPSEGGLIALILFSFLVSCLAFFSDKYLKFQWKQLKGTFFPKEYKDFVPVFRGLMLTILILSVLAYILIITGVF